MSSKLIDSDGQTPPVQVEDRSRVEGRLRSFFKFPPKSHDLSDPSDCDFATIAILVSEPFRALSDVATFLLETFRELLLDVVPRFSSAAAISRFKPISRRSRLIVGPESILNKR